MAEKRDARNAPHMVLIPWLAQGHLIPMLDLARLLAAAGANITVITTAANVPLSTSSFPASLRFSIIPFPCPSLTGLPPGCENVDSLPSRHLAGPFYSAAKLLRDPIEHLLLRGLPPLPPPSCLLFGIGFPWLASLAREVLPVPRLMFQGFSSFTHLASHYLHAFRTHEQADNFLLPGLPHKVEITRSKLPVFFDKASEVRGVYEEIRQGELSADGVVVNSFEELEPEYASMFAKAAGKKVWTVGPVSICQREMLDVCLRGRKASSGFDAERCKRWLDDRAKGSVLYVSFGSMGRLEPKQTVELGMGLVTSGRPFIWMVREGAPMPPAEVEEVGIRGMVIRGWAPQLMVLSHAALGGFLTHCGWNSVVEGVAAGVPMVTWPLGADQFLNEKLVVEVLKIGVEVGGRREGALVGREEVARAVERVMGIGEEGNEIRRRAKELADKARRAMADSGSSALNLTQLIHDAAYWPAT